ncbi:MAG: GNAT family N-acetyltransferase [Leptolyngbya sp. SIO1E4]|nr:GNAT family N-acetyltransferase [Leptolyngbya sp. SIO1E4]
MSDIIIKKAQKDDFEMIARLISEQNKDPRTHCIQSDTGKGYEEISQEMACLELDTEICFTIAVEGDRCLGVFGCELDEESGRGWLRGPFALVDAQNWNKVVTDLYQKLLATLPPTIHQLDGFLNIANERGNRFYLNQGFRQHQLVHVYVANKPEIPLILSPNCERLQARQAPGFIALHDSIFPETYASGRRLVTDIDDDHQVFVYAKGDEVLGYLYGEIETGSEEGLVEFIGVREDVRGQGIGFQLLQTALHWFFIEKTMAEVGLNVNDELANARSLYEKSGFRLSFTGINTRKEW